MINNVQHTLVISVPKAVGNGVTPHTIKVEYEWKPPKCNTCMVFGHDDAQCPIKHAMADVRKLEGTSNDGFQTVQRKDFRGPLGSKKGTIMRNLWTTWLTIHGRIWRLLPRRLRIWPGRKADSPKRNVVFSPEAHIHYFDRDDMDFDDMGQAAEEVEHRNAYSENG
uniref:Zinc knuckle CX2CX4HX4C n=1 Tax=Tanacetum cinerariifolium TaxID=118510 RepID=A0A6L2LWD3_TANCI|nr:hypothetical protein [Tanacetum cinerariifolium]